MKPIATTSCQQQVSHFTLCTSSVGLPPDTYSQLSFTVNSETNGCRLLVLSAYTLLAVPNPFHLATYPPPPPPGWW